MEKVPHKAKGCQLVIQDEQICGNHHRENELEAIDADFCSKRKTKVEAD